MALIDVAGAGEHCATGANINVALRSKTKSARLKVAAIVDISARKRMEERNPRHQQYADLMRSTNPLEPIVANAHAALRWLSNERPNFDEARAALKAIVSAGHRAGEIARSLHSTFKKGSHRDR